MPKLSSYSFIFGRGEDEVSSDTQGSLEYKIYAPYGTENVKSLSLTFPYEYERTLNHADYEILSMFIVALVHYN